MSGDWIKMRGNLWDDPRVSRLCDMTGQAEAAVIGALYWLWATADQHTEDGILPGQSLRQIDRKTGVTGFGAAVCAIGWLEETADGVRLCRFEEHNGKSAKRRLLTAKRVADHKANGKVTHAALPNDDDDVSGALPREREEKREERNTPTPDGVGGARPAAETPVPASVPDCPHKAVLALWAEVLPSQPQHDAEMWHGTRADHLRARWRETAVLRGWTSQEQGLAYLRKLFAYIGKSAFLTGREHTPSRRPFYIELEWLVSPRNWARVIEGKYHEDQHEATRV